jgi:hypothetical protein
MGNTICSAECCSPQKAGEAQIPINDVHCGTSESKAPQMTSYGGKNNSGLVSNVGGIQQGNTPVSIAKPKKLFGVSPALQNNRQDQGVAVEQKPFLEDRNHKQQLALVRKSLLDFSSLLSH